MRKPTICIGENKAADQLRCHSNQNLILLEYKRTNGPVNAHLIWTALLVVELYVMTPDLHLRRGQYRPKEHRWQDLYRGLLKYLSLKLWTNGRRISSKSYVINLGTQHY